MEKWIDLGHIYRQTGLNPIYGRNKKAIKGKWQVIRYWSANDRNMWLKE